LIVFGALLENIHEFVDWSWNQFEPYFQDLEKRPINQKSLAEWMADWSRLSELLNEVYWRGYVATTVDTTDQLAQQRYARFLDEIYPPSQAADQRLKQRLIASQLEPPDFAIPWRNMRAEADLFRRDNLPLLADEYKLAAEYDRIIGAQTVEWQGQERTIAQLQPVNRDPDREARERAWRLAADRQLQDREAINALWVRFMNLRGQLAANAGKRDYRDYRWQQMLRFDYTPEDCLQFHQAIEEVVVPAARRFYEKRRQRLGVETLRPWDLEVDPFERPPLHPFASIAELEEKTAAIFEQVDPQLGQYFAIMRQEGLLDLDNRIGKAPGGYCTEFAATGRPFIFMNAVGLHDDVQTLLHEGGHAFHVFEMSRLPLFHQRQVPLEFMEVASMSMELLAAPYLATTEGGFYTGKDAARARSEHLEQSLLFWPYMAVVDAFQHWAYTHHAEATDPDRCDARWVELWERYMPGVDWSGLEVMLRTGWHRKLHIHQVPFYYIEYGLAQLGAMQVWAGALENQTGAVAAYRKALALGGKAALPELYRVAGARFAFDAATLRAAVHLGEATITRLEEV
jgi:oligoendopeptidase F